MVNKNEYLPHPEIKLLFRKDYLMVFTLMHVPFYFMLFFTRDYPDFLGSMDGTIFIFWLVFALAIKPMMMRGIITAYYRKHYKTKYEGSLLSLSFTFLLYGAMLRTILMVSNIGIQIATWDVKEVPTLVQNLKANLLDMNGAMVGILLFFLFLYLIYYKDRFISIQDFSNRTMKLVRERGLRLDVAMGRVLSERQREVEHKAILHVKYDGQPETTASPAVAYHNVVREEIRQDQRQERNINKNSKVVPMRRRSRK